MSSILLPDPSRARRALPQRAPPGRLPPRLRRALAARRTTHDESPSLSLIAAESADDRGVLAELGEFYRRWWEEVRQVRQVRQVLIRLRMEEGAGAEGRGRGRGEGEVEDLRMRCLKVLEERLGMGVNVDGGCMIL